MRIVALHLRVQTWEASEIPFSRFRKFITMKIIYSCALAVFLAQVVNCTVLNTTFPKVTNDRQERFFSLFSIVRFPNSACTGSNSYNGTCLTNSECTAYGGTASGSCASGFGVCCIVAFTSCGKTAQLNNTYWQNPSYPSTTSASFQCTLYVEKISSDICQLRLDFVEFILAQPSSTASTGGQCLTDSFTISGSSNNVPTICGNNNNQHLYVDMTPGTNTFTLNIMTTGTSDARTWNILVRQIPCGAIYTAPDHCLQWYTESSGTITSFNYQYATSPTLQHLANQDYTICIRPNQGFCGVKYDQCTPTATSTFGISTKADGTSAASATVLDASCIFDFLAIPCASDTANSIVTSVSATTGCVSKICGVVFSASSAATATGSVYTYSQPFEVRFYTDSSEKLVQTTGNEAIGFCLTYAQQPCRSTITGK